MAITNITPIKSTVNKAINYVTSDKFENLSALKNDVKDVIDYTTKDKSDNLIVFPTISSSINCSIENANKEWLQVRLIYNKNSKNLAYHVWQSFEEKIDGYVANEIGRKLAEECFSGFQCVVSTHTNTDHTHNHIVFNSVGLDGKKYNDCDNTYAKIREVSDRLCEEYGLSTIEHGKNYSRYKNNRSLKRNTSSNDFHTKSDYRNYNVNYKDYDTTNRKTIKIDIDNMIVSSKSFNDFIIKMENMGYEIKYLNSKGGYLKHISFKAPMHQKFTRGYSIGDEYTRDNIIKRIENKEDVLETNTSIKLVDYSIYSTNRNIIYDLNDEYRKRKNKDNSIDIVKRGSVEKYIIVDIRKLHNDINDIYDDALKIKHHKPYSFSNKKTQYLMERINLNFKTLKFVEDNNIHSFDDINSTVVGLYDKRKQIQQLLKTIRNELKSCSEKIAIISQYKNLNEQINSNIGNNDYEAFELKGDRFLLEKYKVALNNLNLLEQDKQDKIIKLYDKWNNDYKSIVNSMVRINEVIAQYDNCVRAINLIDKENINHNYKNDISKYYNIRNQNKSKSKSEHTK